MLLGYLSDRYENRTTIAILCILPTILGAGLMVGVSPNDSRASKGVLVAGTALVGCLGAAWMLVLTHITTSMASSPVARTTLLALSLITYNVGTMFGALSFQDPNVSAPAYLGGKITLLGTLTLLGAVMCVSRWHLGTVQRERKEGAIEGVELPGSVGRGDDVGIAGRREGGC